MSIFCTKAIQDVLNCLICILSIMIEQRNTPDIIEGVVSRRFKWIGRAHFNHEKYHFLLELLSYDSGLIFPCQTFLVYATEHFGYYTCFRNVLECLSG